MIVDVNHVIQVQYRHYVIHPPCMTNAGAELSTNRYSVQTD